MNERYLLGIASLIPFLRDTRTGHATYNEEILERHVAQQLRYFDDPIMKPEDRSRLAKGSLDVLVMLDELWGTIREQHARGAWNKPLDMSNPNEMRPPKREW